MPIHQVTHINHYETDGPNDAPPVEPSGPLAALGHAEERLGERKYFVRNPKLLKEDALVLQKQLEQGRNALDEAGRVTQAELWKIGANVLFSEGKPHGALYGYLVGVWYLRAGRPACPMPVAYTIVSAKEKEAEFTATNVSELATWLSAALLAPTRAADEPPDVSAEGQGDGEEAESVTTLRTSLHLNVAAAALKLSA
jgi:hypothetical protein